MSLNLGSEEEGEFKSKTILTVEFTAAEREAESDFKFIESRETP